MTLRGLFIRTSVLSHEHRAVERMRIASNQTHCNTSTKSLRSTTRKQSGKSALVQTSGCNQVLAGVFSSCLPRLAGAVAGTCMVVKERPARPSDVHGHGPGWRVDKLIRREGSELLSRHMALVRACSPCAWEQTRGFYSRPHVLDKNNRHFTLTK